VKGSLFYKCAAKPLGSRGATCGGDSRDHRIDRATVGGTVIAGKLVGALPMHGFVMPMEKGGGGR
jgi:hypothetical protein